MFTAHLCVITASCWNPFCGHSLASEKSPNSLTLTYWHPVLVSLLLPPLSAQSSCGPQAIYPFVGSTISLLDLCTNFNLCGKLFCYLRGSLTSLYPCGQAWMSLPLEKVFLCFGRSGLYFCMCAPGSVPFSCLNTRLSFCFFLNQSYMQTLCTTSYPRIPCFCVLFLHACRLAKLEIFLGTWFCHSLDFLWKEILLLAHLALIIRVGSHLLPCRSSVACFEF